jgi:hypothetical protein
MSKKDRLGRREIRTYNKKKKAAEKGKGNRVRNLNEKLMNRQMDSIKAGVDVDYESGTYSYSLGGTPRAGYGKVMKAGGAMVADRNKNGVLEGWEKAIDKKIKASMNAKAKYGYAMEGMNMASKGYTMKAKDNRRIRLTRKNK